MIRQVRDMNSDFGIFINSLCSVLGLLYEAPSGNQVDGLPLVASNTGEECIGQPTCPYKCVTGAPFIYVSSASVYRNELARRQIRTMIMRFDFL